MANQDFPHLSFKSNVHYSFKSRSPGLWRRTVVVGHNRFRVPCCLHLQDETKAARTPESLVSYHNTILQHDLKHHHRESLISRSLIVFIRTRHGSPSSAIRFQSKPSHPITLRYILILSSHIHLLIPSCLISWGSQSDFFFCGLYDEYLYYSMDKFKIKRIKLSTDWLMCWFAWLLDS
jgi:hypothetical protein